MLSDSRTFNLSRSGRAYMRFLLAYNSNNAGQLQAFIQRSFTPEFLEKTPVDTMVNWCLNVHLTIGELEIHKVYFSEEYFIIVIVIDKKGNQYLHKLKIQDEPPHLVTEFIHEDT